MWQLLLQRTSVIKLNSILDIKKNLLLLPNNMYWCVHTKPAVHHLDLKHRVWSLEDYCWDLSIHLKTFYWLPITGMMLGDVRLNGNQIINKLVFPWQRPHEPPVSFCPLKTWQEDTIYEPEVALHQTITMPVTHSSLSQKWPIKLCVFSLSSLWYFAFASEWTKIIAHCYLIAL